MRSTPKSLSVIQSNALNCVCGLARLPFCCVFLPWPWGFLADVWLFVLQLADSYQTINISSIYLPGMAVLYTQAAQSEVFLADVSETFAGFVCCLCRKWSRALGMQSYSCNIRSKLIATERESCPSLYFSVCTGVPQLWVILKCLIKKITILVAELSRSASAQVSWILCNSDKNLDINTMDRVSSSSFQQGICSSLSLTCFFSPYYDY